MEDSCIEITNCNYWFCRTNNKCLLGNRPKIAKIIAVQENNVKNPNKIKRRRIHHAVRNYVFERDNKKCVKCKTTKNLTIDHIIPLSKGGLDLVPNFQTMCKSCNIKKGNK